MTLNHEPVLIHTCFQVSEMYIDTFKSLSENLIESTRGEMGCLFFSFSFNKREAFWLESYKDAQSLMAHISNVDDLTSRISKISKIKEQNIHAPLSQLDLIKEFLVEGKANLFPMESYFQNY